MAGAFLHGGGRSLRGGQPSKVGAPVPALLQPKAPFAADAIVVGDPGRALLLAQELLEQPKMCNHARGLWGYRGVTPEGHELTIQSTGIGAPSAAAVLADLAELGVRRAIRIGVCMGLHGASELGEILLVTEAVAAEGSATALGVEVGEAVAVEGELLKRLAGALGADARPARIVSLDTVPAAGVTVPGVEAADMQTLAVLARGRALGIRSAALLVVTETDGDTALEGEDLETVARLAGRAARSALSG